MNFNGSLMELRREKRIFKEQWHVRVGKDHQEPQNGLKSCILFKLYKHGFKKYVCQTVWYMILHCKQSCKARLKNDKDLG